MHLLVTGSSGLIGTALVDAASARGDTVTRLVRRSVGTGRRRRPAGVTDVSWDPDAGHVDLDALAATGPVDGVVHLAGAGVGDKRWTPARKRVIIESRTRGTDLLARTVAGLDPRPGVLVSASAVGWYGDRGDDVLVESEPAGTGFLAGVCVEWEAATAPAEAAGIRTVHLRTGIVLSPTGGALAKQLPLFRLGVGGQDRLGPPVPELDHPGRRGGAPSSTAWTTPRCPAPSMPPPRHRRPMPSWPRPSAPLCTGRPSCPCPPPPSRWPSARRWRPTWCWPASAPSRPA